MASYDSADLLALFNRKAGRPSADAISDPTKYDRLSKSQQRVVSLIASVAPYALYPKVAYGSLPTLSTVDNQVFTFGTDSNGYAVTPFGKAQVYRSLNDIPNYPLVEGYDFLNEGTQIRIPNNRTYSGTLYWRGAQAPPDIDASSQPSLFPEGARELIVIDAVRQFSTEGGRDDELAALMQSEWNQAWPTWCLVFKTQFRQGGALSARWSTREVAMLTPTL